MIILDVNKTPGMFGDRSFPWFILFHLCVSHEEIRNYLQAKPVVANDANWGDADYWAIQFDCGLKIALEAFHESPHALVYADAPCRQHVTRHLFRWEKNLVDVSDQFVEYHNHLIQRFLGEMSELQELKSYQVWRQGDDGNQVSIGSPTTKRDAQCWVAELESHHHKQIYWVAHIDQDNIGSITPRHLQ